MCQGRWIELHVSAAPAIASSHRDEAFLSSGNNGSIILNFLEYFGAQTLHTSLTGRMIGCESINSMVS